MMKILKPKSVELTMNERADDAAELAKQEPDQADLASRIDAYLSDQFSAAEMDALSRTNQKEIDAEIDRRNRVAAEKRAREARKAKALWFDDLATKADCVAADAEILKFIRAHPSFPRHIPENANLLLRWLADNNLLCTLENLEKGYAFLRPQGVFIQQSEEEQRIGRMSAEQYRRENASDWPQQGIPPLVMVGIEKALDTFAQANPQFIHSPENAAKMIEGIQKSGLSVSVQNLESVFRDLVARGELELNNSVQRGEVLRYTDMGGHAPGYPAQPRKYSLRAKLKSMTADEVKQRILDDPNFESALNSLK
jgi:hypothetical protein